MKVNRSVRFIFSILAMMLTMTLALTPASAQILAQEDAAVAATRVEFELASPIQLKMGPNGETVQLREFILSVDASASEGSVSKVNLFWMRFGYPFSRHRRNKRDIRQLLTGSDERGEYLRIHLGTAPVQDILVYPATKEIFALAGASYQRTLIGVGRGY